MKGKYISIYTSHCSGLDRSSGRGVRKDGGEGSREEEDETEGV